MSMLSQVYQQHKEAQVQAKAEHTRLHAAAAEAAAKVADELVLKLNQEVVDVFRTQRDLEGEIRTMQTRLGKYIGLIKSTDDR
eukprot:m.66649 g.66649  ORF g.66649 m.66649 type:complete len:83 (+) comp12129_c0_seq3:146-394(+)